MEEQITFNNPESSQETQFLPNEQLQQIVQSGEIVQLQSFEQAPAQVKYAGFWIRYVAYMIDGTIISIFAGLGAVPIIMNFNSINPSLRIILGPVMYLSLIFLVYGYLIITTKKYQATLGKKVLGLIVVRSDLSETSWGRVILRETVGKIVSGMIFNIGYIMAGFTQKKQGLHDIIADTIVIYKDPSRKIRTWIAIVVALIIPLVFIISVSTILIKTNTARSKSQEAYQKQLELGIKNNQQINNSMNEIQSGNANDSVPTRNPEPSVSTSDAIGGAQVYDMGMEANLLNIATQLNVYFTTNNTYKGFAFDDAKTNLVQNEYCRAWTIFSVSSDGQNFILYRPLCSDYKKVFCIEKGMNAVSTSDTINVNKTYHCK